MGDRFDVNAVEFRRLVKNGVLLKVLMEPHFQAGCTRGQEHPVHVKTVVHRHIAKAMLLLSGDGAIWKEHASRQQISIFGRVGLSHYTGHQLAVNRSDFLVHLGALRVLRPTELIEHECEQITVPPIIDVLLDPSPKPTDNLFSMVDIETIWAGLK
jgi:hypothetical protein